MTTYPTHVTLISPGTELANWQGKLHMNTDQPRWYPMNNVGYANVGEVVAAGSELAVRPGPRVYSMGNHASIVRVDARERFCAPVQDGRLRVEPLITHRLPPSEIQHAYEGLLTRKDVYLGVILRWS